MHRLIERLPLARGAHATRADGMCAMEMVAWLAGEPHSDEPRCACPVIAALVRACNDVMGDVARNRYLRPLVPILVDTRATAAVERARGLLVLDALLRRFVPAALRGARRNADADAFAALLPIGAREQLERAARALEHCGAALRPAGWMVQRALDGMPAERFVAGLAQLARIRDDAWTWGEVAELLERMAGLGRQPPWTARAD